MNLFSVFMVIVGFLAAFTLSEKARYDNFRVFRVNVENEAQLNALQSIDGDFDFWKEPSLGRTADVMVKPEQMAEFQKLIKTFEINSDLSIDDVQRLIDSEYRATHTKDDSFTFDSYHDLASINIWLDEQLELHSNVLTGITVGYSFEGRTIRAVRLSHKAGNPIIFLDANIHAREWITSATAIWILNEFLTSTNPAVRDLAQNIDWVIVPVINVDGFQYSHTNYRLWRKTRQPYAQLCFGTDPNRNFNSSWMTNGTSRNPCSDVFGGPRPFSEPETVALAKLITTLGSRVKAYLSLHSYGQYVLFPYGHTKDKAPHFDILNTIGTRTAKAFEKRNGKVFTVGPPPVVLYATSGASMDWAYEQNITISYTFELRDNGTYGFVLPADQIISVGQETLDGFIELVHVARELGQL